MNPPTPNSSPVILVAKIEDCESLSGLSTLQYHVGYEAGSFDRLYFRIWANSGNGKFSHDWVSLASIGKCLADVPPDGAFKAAAFNDILPGRSINTPAFIAAACLAEGLIRRSETVSRQYERNAAPEWLEELKPLIEAGTDLTPAPMRTSAGDNGAAPSGKKPKAKKLKPTPAVAT